MKTILVNSATYTLRPPQLEEDLAREVEEHVKDLFGEEAVYFNLKKKIATPAGIASIPDAYVIVLADTPEWYVIEIELASHPLYDHIITQVTKFIQGLKRHDSRESVRTALYKSISSDPTTQAAFRTKAPGGEIYKLLYDLLSRNPTLVIAIDQATPDAREACDNLPTASKILELSTFVSAAGGSLDHAHLYEPLGPLTPRSRGRPGTAAGQERHGRVITVPDVQSTGELPVAIYATHKGRKHEARLLPGWRVQIDSHLYKSPSGAAVAITQYPVNGWRFWQYTDEAGQERTIDHLRQS